MISQINTQTLRRFGPKPRIGKTANDRTNGAMRRNYENKEPRAEWSREKGKVPFPEHTCKGKGNSSKALKFGASKVRH